MAAFFIADGNEYERHIGDKLGIKAEEVTEVQLDGHELEFVRNEFTNIRMCRERVVTLYGDDAKFVAKHWR